MSEKYRKFLDVNGIRDGLLREFVIKGNLQAAVDECASSIKKRENEIEAIKRLKADLAKERRINRLLS